MSPALQSLDPSLRDKLNQQRMRDLAERSLVGVLIYPLVWWTLTLPRLWYAPSEDNFRWLGGIGLLMLACAGTRFLLLKRFRRRLAKGKTTSEWELTVSIMLSTGLWGSAAALSLLDTPLAPFSTVLMAATAGLSAGGIASLAISAQVVLVFLGCMLLPSILVVAFGQSPFPLEFASVLLIFWIGMYWVSSLPRNEYFNAQISNLKLMHQASYLNELTHLDSLTELKNRRYFDQLLEMELKRSVRNQYPLSLLLVDLDRFKQINDRLGHLAGDECLRAVAVTLKAQLKRATDEVARFGGEEFAVVLPSTPRDEAEQIAEMIRAAIAATPAPDCAAGTLLSTSVGGVTLIPDSHTTARDVLKLADDALYRAKAEGRNCVRFVEVPPGAAAGSEAYSS